MKNTKCVLAMSALLLTSVSSWSSVVINEIMPKNVSYQINDQFQFSGWAEILNNGEADEDVSLYFFSDDEENPTKWQITTGEDDLVLKPGDFAVVYFDEFETDDEGEVIPLHASFKLPAKKGCLYLSDQSGITIDRLAYDTVYRNISYGRLADGTLGHFTQPTLGKANADASVATVQTAAPQFSLTPGFYSAEQTVKITADPSATIYYTTDGNEPSTSSKKYTDPLSIKSNTPLRAIAVKEGEINSGITTASYFFNEEIEKLPIVSLVTSPDLLYSDSIGILVAGVNGKEVPSYCAGPDDYANYNTDWDRPCNFEMFDRSKKERLNQEVKIGNFGGCSRTKYIKSIKVNAGKVYGDNKLDYSIFEEKPNLKWKSIVMRNAGNDFGRSYLRDGFIQTLMIGQADIDHQAYQPSMVFINGEFYGMLNIRERTNKDFIYSNYGLDEDGFYLNEGNWANDEESGYLELMNYCVSSNAADADFYDNLCNMMDVNEFLNYFLLEMYCGNSDWPNGNIKCWRDKRDGGKWRWIVYDTEYSLSIYGNTLKTDCFTNAKKHSIFKGAIANEKIKERLLAKFCVHLATTFEPERANHILDSLIANIQPDVERHIEKIASAYKMESDFDKDIQTIRKFINGRPAVMFKNANSRFSVDTLPIHIYSDVKDATFSINEEPIRTSDFSSYFFTKTYCQITANEPAGYNFSHWEISLPNAESPVKLYEPTYCDTFVGGSFKAVYTVDADFDANAPQVYFNEACASNTIYLDEYRETEDWVELYNNSQADYALGGLFVSNNEQNLGMFQIPTSDSTVIKAKDYLVLWADKDTVQGVRHLNFKLSSTQKTTLFLSELKNGQYQILDSVTCLPHKENETYAHFGKYGVVNPTWKITGRPTFECLNIYGTSLDVEDMVTIGESYAYIYPNPAEEWLNFSFSWAEESQVRIATLSGMTVKSFIAHDGEQVSVDDITSGFYIVMVQTPNGMMNFKLIKK